MMSGNHGVRRHGRAAVTLPGHYGKVLVAAVYRGNVLAGRSAPEYRITAALWGT
jgi:hypothetical protein